MKLVDLIQINVDKNPDANQLLLTALSKLPWLERFDPEEINFEIAEKLYFKLAKKYPARVGYIQNAGVENNLIFMVKHTETNAWIETVFCRTYSEGLYKVILVFYAYFIKGMKFHDK